MDNLVNSSGVHGKALVTGSANSGRIGLGIANFLSSIGYEVITHSSGKNADAAKSLRVNDNSNHFICDFTDPLQVDDFVAKIKDVELLVNNASLFVKDDLDSVSFKNLQDHFMIEVFTPLILISRLKKLKNVINILDGRIASNDDYFLSYTLAKRSMGDIIKVCAKKLASRSVRINGIALGYVIYNSDKPKSVYNKMLKETPLGVETAMPELLECIDMILSSNSLTGNITHLDSGMHL